MVTIIHITRTTNNTGMPIILKELGLESLQY
jgi:hypothetical protein